MKWIMGLPHMILKPSTSIWIRKTLTYQEKKVQTSKSIFKSVMIVFFDIPGTIHIEWMPEGQPENQMYYEICTTLVKMCKETSLTCENQDDAPAHSTLHVRCFWPNTQFLSAFKWTCFESLDEMKKKSMERMKAISEDNLQYCFQQWRTCMELYWDDH